MLGLTSSTLASYGEDGDAGIDTDKSTSDVDCTKPSHQWIDELQLLIRSMISWLLGG
jgi:hypothetical protein